MAGPINYQFFEPLKGRTFNTQDDSANPVELLLKNVEKRENAPGGFEFFTLTFDGPLEPRLEQATYILGNDDVEEVAVFLVPVAGDDLGYQYEAVYNIKVS